MAKRAAGFTLVELLVSVAIFSGIVILALGAFARSADSSLRSSAVRERTEAARTIIDRISGDARYVYTAEPFTAGANECANNAQTAMGAFFTDDCLAMVLLSPGANPDGGLVFKRYLRQIRSANQESVFLEEARDCDIVGGTDVNPGALSCPDRTFITSEIISDKFAIVDGADPVYQTPNRPLFSGLSPQEALANNVTPVLELHVVVRPTLFSQECSESPGSCYAIRTSFVPGD